MARILVTERIADAGLQRLRDAGHEVDEQLDLDPADLIEAVRGAHALIIRSATTVSADVVSAGVGLVVVGRAGIGLDNVDVEAATRQGIMVVNAPDANVLSAAEHTMALLLAQARNVPQAHGALREGRWERAAWQGVEVADKTLGIVGLGRIGGLVAQRAKAFGMKVIAFDPFVSEERARQEDIELMSLEELMAQSDFVTLHVAKTPETMGMINADLLAGSKPGLRLINVARGGIVDEQALADAIASGHIAGALNIELGELQDHLDGLPRELPVVTVCASGARASTAGSILRRDGRENVQVVEEGGVPQWISLGYPAETGE
ncbi:MAG: hypothetical protein IH940_07300 [Acidobacteria bacterium]|nr:hypothetical protein [Acidobacteriota bacterium]